MLVSTVPALCAIQSGRGVATALVFKQERSLILYEIWVKDGGRDVATGTEVQRARDIAADTHIETQVRVGEGLVLVLVLILTRFLIRERQRVHASESTHIRDTLTAIKLKRVHAFKSTHICDTPTVLKIQHTHVYYYKYALCCMCCMCCMCWFK
jgi:hypothetical protein